jgi:biofilm protein TabA
MLHATLSDPGTWMPLLGHHRVWNRSLEWLKGLTPETPLGTYHIDGPKWYASVQTYETLPSSECRFESHEEHIDIQYTIVGSEVIDWIERASLQPDGPFANDVQFWQAPEESKVSHVTNEAGRFSVFFPSDAHRPKGRDPRFPDVRKVVIKIHRSLLER